LFFEPDDFDRLRKLAAEKRSITIVGNGFIGSELACSLAHYSRENNGGKVYQVFQENANMSKVLPNYLSRWTTAKMEAQGVCVIPNASIRSAVRDETSSFIIHSSWISSWMQTMGSDPTKNFSILSIWY